MPGSKNNCPVEILRKIANQRWPGQFFIKGNSPYDKGVEFISLEGEEPSVVCTFKKNNDAFMALMNPNWYPGKEEPKVLGLFPSQVSNYLKNLRGQKLFYEKTIALKQASDERLNLIKINPQEENILQELMFRLDKIKKRLASGKQLL